MLTEAPETEYPPSPVDWNQDKEELVNITGRLKSVRTKLISLERDRKNAAYQEEWNAELRRYVDRSPPSQVDACGVSSWDDVVSDHSSSSGDRSSLSEDYRSSTSPRMKESAKSWWSADRTINGLSSITMDSSPLGREQGENINAINFICLNLR